MKRVRLKWLRQVTGRSVPGTEEASGNRPKCTRTSPRIGRLSEDWFDPIKSRPARAGTVQRYFPPVHRAVGRADDPAPKEIYRGGADLKWIPEDPQNYESKQRAAIAVRDEWAKFLENFMWDEFATYTFAEPTTSAGAHHMFESHLKFLESRSGLGVYAFRADEYGTLHGRFHLHALLGNVGDFPADCGKKKIQPGTPCCGAHSWPCGWATVSKYDPDRGAVSYCSKYVTKGFGDWGMYGDFIGREMDKKLFDL